MRTLLFGALVLAASVLQGGEILSVSPAAGARELAGDLQTGSLIFSRGDCLAVKVFSASGFTHVACVVVEEGTATVYDSTGGAGVRKQTLVEYFASQDDARLAIFTPCRAFSSEQSRAFTAHLESQLGRPYAITHHLTGNRCEGLHCAEYATDALIACEVLKAERPPRVSPASLLKGITRAELYVPAETLALEPEPTEPPGDARWCSRMWFSTKLCTRNCYLKLRGLFCCK